MPINFLSWIGFLQVTWNGMLTSRFSYIEVLQQWYTYKIWLLISEIIFATQRQAIFVFLRKKTFFDSAFDFEILLWTLCSSYGMLSFHVYISQSFAIFAKSYAHQMNVFVSFAKIGLIKMKLIIINKHQNFWNQ